jgi:CheY-like chemotaxis protein
MAKSRILIVDDEENIRTALERWFETIGYDVTVAGDGQEAIDLCQENTFDVITMDLEMPRVSGLEAIVAIKAIHPDLPIIVLTGFFNKSDEALTSGATKILVKPVSLRDLQEEVQKLVPVSETPATE